MGELICELAQSDVAAFKEFTAADAGGVKPTAGKQPSKEAESKQDAPKAEAAPSKPAPKAAPQPSSGESSVCNVC